MAALDRYFFTHCWPALAALKKKRLNTYPIGNWNGTQQDRACQWRDEPGKGILQIPFNVRSLTLQRQFCVPKFCFMPYIYSPFMERGLGTVLTILGVLLWMGGILREPHLKMYTNNVLSVLDIHNFFLQSFCYEIACHTNSRASPCCVFFFLNPLHYCIFWCPFQCSLKIKPTAYTKISCSLFFVWRELHSHYTVKFHIHFNNSANSTQMKISTCKHETFLPYSNVNATFPNTHSLRRKSVCSIDVKHHCLICYRGK